MKKFLFIFLFTVYSFSLLSQTLNLPQRNPNAPKGSTLITSLSILNRDDRENEIYSQVISGNVPNFLRTLVPVTSTMSISGTNHSVTYYVTPEYFAIGSDDDYFLIPMTPLLGQRLANYLDCSMPTRKMVNDIYFAAPLKVRPQPIAPTAEMITVPVFKQSNDSIWSLRKETLNSYPLGTLIGGHKKDVIISNSIYTGLKANVPKPVVIYGWHRLDGQPIQPLYNGHEETYADYSHGIRLIANSITVDVSKKTIAQILSDANLYTLLSDEGMILNPKYNNPITILVPSTPKSFAVVSNGAGSVKILFTQTNDTTFYKAFISNDGINFKDSVSISKDNYIINNLTTDSICYIRLRANNSSGYSGFSEVLASVPSTKFDKTLIANGFDRNSTGNTFNFIRQHGKAIKDNGINFNSATNEAVVVGLVSLNDYNIVDYILGDESTVDETFSTAEQEIIKNYLKAGGSFFASGSEIAWDLDTKGSSADKDFIRNYLKTQYINDAPAGKTGVYYQAEQIPDKIFDGIGTFSFDNGTQGTINVKYPDAINGINGGINCLAYSGVTIDQGAAGTYYDGAFPNGTKNGKVVILGFPFETIYPENTRKDVMKKILGFFLIKNNVNEMNSTFPDNYSLSQNYPNPFNPNTTISYHVTVFGHVSLKIYDVLGREISTLLDGFQNAGTYSLSWTPKSLKGELPSGIYYYSLHAGNYFETKKMVYER